MYPSHRDASRKPAGTVFSVPAAYIAAQPSVATRPLPPCICSLRLGPSAARPLADNRDAAGRPAQRLPPPPLPAAAAPRQRFLLLLLRLGTRARRGARQAVQLYEPHAHAARARRTHTPPAHAAPTRRTRTPHPHAAPARRTRTPHADPDAPRAVRALLLQPPPRPFCCAALGG